MARWPRLGWLLGTAAVLAVGPGLGIPRAPRAVRRQRAGRRPRGANHGRAAGARPHRDARVGDGDGGLLQHPGGPGESRRSGPAGSLARRALAHDRQPQLHLLPQEGGALPRRARAHRRGREVRPRPRAEPRDQASPRQAVRGHRDDPRAGPLHRHGRAQADQRDVPLQSRAPGLGDLSAGGGGPAEVAAHRDRAVHAGALGPGRPHRPEAQPRVSRQGAAEARAGHVPVHSRRQRRPGGAPGGGHRRDGVRPRARSRSRSFAARRPSSSSRARPRTTSSWRSTTRRSRSPTSGSGARSRTPSTSPRS